MSDPGAVEQLELIRSGLPRRHRARTTEATASTDPVASVVVDTGLAHLDRPFEYLVPASMADSAVPGARGNSAERASSKPWSDPYERA